MPGAIGCDGGDTLASRIAPPPGFERPAAAPASFAAWLRGLPLKPAGAPVLLHTGAPKFRQDVHVAVIDIDVGARDLQQCADAIMRLRAEWLFASGPARRHRLQRHGRGQAHRLRPLGRRRAPAHVRPLARLVAQRRAGCRLCLLPPLHGRRSSPGPAPIRSSASSRAEPLAELAAGDLFIKGGFPGHAVLVADVVENRATGERRFLLVQSFMPAQEMHVLKNPADADGSPWYPLAFGDRLVTPEWVFPRESLRRWRRRRVQ